MRRQAEEQWVKRFHESSEAESRKLQDELNEINQEQILKRALPRVHSTTSRTAWACFEQRMLRDRPGADIALELGITAEAVYVYASRVLKGPFASNASRSQMSWRRADRSGRRKRNEI